MKEETRKKKSEHNQYLFADKYLANGGNATRAYMEVFGRSYGVSAVEGHKLLKKPNLIAYIEEHRAKALANSQLTVQRWYQEVARLSFFDPRKLVDEKGKLKPLHELDDDTAAALSAIEAEVGSDGTVITRVRPHSKTTALDLAAKVLRVYDAPPPPPPDDDKPIDAAENAKWLAFMLRRGAKKLPSP